MIRECTRAIWCVESRKNLSRSVRDPMRFHNKRYPNDRFGSNQLRGALDKSTFLNVSAATSSFLVMEMTAKPSVCKTQLVGCNCIANKRHELDGFVR